MVIAKTHIIDPTLAPSKAVTCFGRLTPETSEGIFVLVEQIDGARCQTSRMRLMRDDEDYLSIRGKAPTQNSKNNLYVEGYVTTVTLHNGDTEFRVKLKSVENI